MASAYLELSLAENRRAYVDISSIQAVITSPGCDLFDPSTDAAPVGIVLRGGATIESVDGSAGKILARAMNARVRLRKDAELDIFIDYLADHAGPVQEPVDQGVSVLPV